MDLRDVQNIGRELMDQHGLFHWSFGFDRAMRRAGACHFSRREITVSRHLCALYDRELVVETVLHEIAHALVGPGVGHGPAWRRTARAIGCSGERTIGPQAPVVVGAWLGECPVGHQVFRFRRPSADSSCLQCRPSFSSDHLFSWRRREEAA